MARATDPASGYNSDDATVKREVGYELGVQSGGGSDPQGACREEDQGGVLRQHPPWSAARPS